MSPACPLGDRGLLVGNQPAFDLGELRRRLVCLHRQRKPPASAGAPEQGLVDLGNPSGRLFPPRPAISCIAAGVMRPQSPVRRRPRSHAWRGRSGRSVWTLCQSGRTPARRHRGGPALDFVVGHFVAGGAIGTMHCRVFDSLGDHKLAAGGRDQKGRHLFNKGRAAWCDEG